MGKEKWVCAGLGEMRFQIGVGGDGLSERARI